MCNFLFQEDIEVLLMMLSSLFLVNDFTIFKGVLHKSKLTKSAQEHQYQRRERCRFQVVIFVRSERPPPIRDEFALKEFMQNQQLFRD